MHTASSCWLILFLWVHRKCNLYSSQLSEPYVPSNGYQFRRRKCYHLGRSRPCSSMQWASPLPKLWQATLHCFWNHKWSRKGWGGAGCHGYCDKKMSRVETRVLNTLPYRAHSELGRSVPEPALHLNVWLGIHLACNLSLLKIKWQSEFCGTRELLHILMFTVLSIHPHPCFLVVLCSM